MKLPAVSGILSVKSSISTSPREVLRVAVGFAMGPRRLGAGSGPVKSWPTTAFPPRHERRQTLLRSARPRLESATGPRFLALRRRKYGECSSRSWSHASIERPGRAPASSPAPPAVARLLLSLTRSVFDGQFGRQGEP